MNDVVKAMRVSEVDGRSAIDDVMARKVLSVREGNKCLRSHGNAKLTTKQEFYSGVLTVSAGGMPRAEVNVNDDNEATKVQVLRKATMRVNDVKSLSGRGELLAPAVSVRGGSRVRGFNSLP